MSIHHIGGDASLANHRARARADPVTATQPRTTFGEPERPSFCQTVDDHIRRRTAALKSENGRHTGVVDDLSATQVPQRD